MKKVVLFCLLITLTIPFGCTDVIEVDVPDAAPRLVIEASMDWRRGTLGNVQEIKLSLSTPFFDNLQKTPVSGASVKVIKGDDLSEFIFNDLDDGTYTTDQFIAELNQTYTLEVIYDNEVFRASEVMTPVTRISDVYQSRENGFDNSALEVNIDFEDPIATKNFYLTRFQRKGDLLPTLFDLKDEFTNGNLMTVFYEKLNNDNTGEKEFEPGDVVDIDLYGISEQYYNYIRLLIMQSGGVGGPFSTIPSEIKGNCVNLTDPDHYAFGYFRLAEYDSKSYEFE